MRNSEIPCGQAPTERLSSQSPAMCSNSGLTARGRITGSDGLAASRASTSSLVAFCCRQYSMSAWYEGSGIATVAADRSLVIVMWPLTLARLLLDVCGQDSDAGWMSRARSRAVGWGVLDDLVEVLRQPRELALSHPLDPEPLQKGGRISCRPARCGCGAPRSLARLRASPWRASAAVSSRSRRSARRADGVPRA